MKSRNFLLIFIQEHWLPSYEATTKLSSDFTSFEFLTTSSDSFKPPEDILLNSGPTRFCGLKIKINDTEIIAYTVYLPTAGQDDDYQEEISLLSHDLLVHLSSESTIIIGTDANTSEKSSARRKESFSSFKLEFGLETILPGQEPTFHHNNGDSESQIDHILTNKPETVKFLEQRCKLNESANLSSHDAIIGTMKLKKHEEPEEKFEYEYEEFKQQKVVWEESTEYQNMSAKILHQLLVRFDQPEHLPALAEMCSNMLAICAEKCFKVKLSKHAHTRQTPRFSKHIREAYHNHATICKNWRKAGRPASTKHPAKANKLISQRYLQKLLRDEEAGKAMSQHNDLMDTHDKNMTDIFNKLNKIRRSQTKTTSIPEIETLKGVYKGENVLEGFRANTESLCNEAINTNFSEDFIRRCEEDLIIIDDLSKHEGMKIPPITIENLKHIVKKQLKNKKACDIYKLTAEHLKHAGDETLKHLCTLINRIIENMEYLEAPELKVALASVIHKGKDKPKTHHKSYRLVRVCPLIVRLIDEYIRPIATQLSRPLQSNNQYGFTEDITYLMGALQRHEAQKYCIDNKKTFFGCSLDGDSAFEVVCRKIQRRELYFAGESGQLTKYNTSTYENTETRIKMNGKMSKPLKETLGVGQGKIRSSDHYKIYINPVLETLDKAELGVNIGHINTGVSCVADDLYLMTDNQTKLQALLDVCQHYGQQYRITYGASKTVISVVGSASDRQYYKEIQPWKMDNLQVSVKDDNDHLGLIVSGQDEETKNVDQKLKKARGALFKLLGPAYSSKCLLSPTVKIHLFRTYICPIARSGLAAMTLRPTHLKSLTDFHKKILRGFLHLSDRSPIPSLYFLTGELPIEARIHRDIFSVFHSICQNPQTKIHSIIKYLLENSAENSHTWARHLSNLASIYEIEDPLKTIINPNKSKKEYKNDVHTRITVFHEKKWRTQALNNSKMSFLNISIKGLNGRCHPALLGIKTTESVRKMRPFLKMLTCDYYTFQLRAKYQGGSPHCKSCEAQPPKNEDLPHILTECIAYSDIRNRIFKDYEELCNNAINQINFSDFLKNPSHLTQFILDCGSLNLPSRISYDDPVCSYIFKLSHDLCFGINKTRINKLKNLKN